MLSSRESVDFLQNPVSDAIGGGMLIFGDQPDQARMPEELQCGALRIPDPIREEHDNIAGIQNIAPLVVADFFKHPQGKSRELDFLASSAMK